MKAILLATAIALASLVPAHSQEHPPIGFCDKREVVIQYLYDVFGQHPFAGGLAGETSESVIEMTVSQKRGWTILNTTKKPDHYWSCIWMWGTGFLLAPVGDPA